jgi:hypothetical protein
MIDLHKTFVIDPKAEMLFTQDRFLLLLYTQGTGNASFIITEGKWPSTLYSFCKNRNFEYDGNYSLP